jgi:hypothetical protein
VRIEQHVPIGESSGISSAKFLTLVIPTENELKTQLLQKLVKDFLFLHKPGLEQEVLQVPVESDVGEQPYNSGALDLGFVAPVRLTGVEQMPTLPPWPFAEARQILCYLGLGTYVALQARLLTDRPHDHCLFKNPFAVTSIHL